MSKTVILTGGTGYIGGAVLRQLVDRGDRVIALVRSDASAAQVEAAGATALRGELTDAAVLRDAAIGADAAIHTAATGDAGGPAADAVASAALQEGLSGKPYVHTGGVWVYGTTDGVADESSPLNPPSLVAWRPDAEAKVLAAGGVVVRPGVVVGDGRGIPATVLVADDAVQYVGDGSIHWSLVHVDDLAALYLLALDGAAPGSAYLGVTGSLTVRAIAEAVAGTGGRPAATRSLPEADVVAGFGAFGEALLLDQQLSGGAAQRDLGWTPAHTDLAAALAS